MRNHFNAKLFLSVAGLFLAAFAVASAGESVALANRLGAEIKTVYGMAPGHTPWKIASALADGKSESVSRERLRACSRIAIDLGDNVILQFFTSAYLDGADDIAIESRPVGRNGGESVPFLLYTAGGQTIPFSAGLPFHLLQGDFENGMSERLYAEWLNPLALADAVPDLYAVSIADTSWHILEPGGVFADDGKGGKVLRSLVLSAPFAGRNLETFIAEMSGANLEPLLLELGRNSIHAFSEQGMKVDDGAKLVEGMANADIHKRWDALSRFIASAKPEDFDEDEPAIRIVFASPAAVYEMLMDLSESVVLLNMERR